MRSGTASGHSSGGGTLTIEACREDSAIRISVADDGAGASDCNHGVGLGNTRARLKQMYGTRQSLEIESAPDAGFKVTVRLPL
jgi:sensor histidine kinase YesM